jgi:hypothetical protein
MDDPTTKKTQSNSRSKVWDNVTDRKIDCCQTADEMLPVYKSSPVFRFSRVIIIIIIPSDAVVGILKKIRAKDGWQAPDVRIASLINEMVRWMDRTSRIDSTDFHSSS